MNEEIQWGKWSQLGDADGTEQRYICRILVDGEWWRACAGNMERERDGLTAANAGRGQMRSLSSDPVTVYSEDGIECAGYGGAEVLCREALSYVSH